MPFKFFRPIQVTNYSQHLLSNKYAPTRLEDLAGQDKIVESLIKFRDSQNVPNLIVTGPPGTGKKIAVDLLTKSILQQHAKTDCFYLDGSIDRGKNVVSENLNSKKKFNPEINIINFLKKRSSLPSHLYRIIVIADFDHMTDEAQMALRRIIETQSHRVRFIFIANELTNIIEAIQSRSVILKFNLLLPEKIKPILHHIATQEHHPISEEILDLIILMSHGDLKQSITHLQVFLQSPQTTVESFYRIFSIPQVQEIQRLFQACLTAPENPYAILQDLLDQGYQAIDLLDMMMKLLLTNPWQLSKSVQIQFLQRVGQGFYENDLTNTNHHLYALIADLYTHRQATSI